LFGSSIGFAASFELSSLSGNNNGFAINGIDAGDQSGAVQNIPYFEMKEGMCFGLRVELAEICLNLRLNFTLVV